MTLRPRVLYIASSGIRDPLIVSQVLRYLKRLTNAFEVCHLLTLEREALPKNEIESLTAELREFRISWHPITARPGHRALNMWREIYAGRRVGASLVLQHSLNIVHARSFIPGIIGLRITQQTQAKLLYDMRGFWAEEKKAKGTIQHRWMYQAAAKIEERLLSAAHALVSLTHAGKRELQQKGVETPIDVIPCCVDTDLFRPSDGDRDGMQHLISVGSLGAGYLPELVLGVFARLQKRFPGASLQLLTRTPTPLVYKSAKNMGCDTADIRIQSAPPDEVVHHLNAATVGLCMIQPSYAKIASSPTKVAEYLACGLPVIANCQGIGDMDNIVVGQRVGVSVDPNSREQWDSAIADFASLLQDPQLRQRCRRIARRDFSLDVGVHTYSQIYDRLVA